MERMTGRLKKYAFSPFEVFALMLIGGLSIGGILSLVNPLERGLKTLYFTNAEWSGTPVMTAEEQQITRDRMARVFPQKTTDYSIQWVGFIRIPEEGEYEFTLVSDDGSSLFLDQVLLIDNGGFHGKQEMSGQRYLTKGFHAIHLNYMQGQGTAIFRAFWTPPGQVRQPLSHAVLTQKPLGRQAYWIGRGIEVVLLCLKVFLGLCLVGGLWLVLRSTWWRWPQLRPRHVSMLMFWLVFVSHFVWSDVTTVWDSKWTIHTALSIIREGNADLDEYAPITRQFQDHTVVEYFGHTYNLYPIGTSLLAAPVVYLVDLFLEDGWLLDMEQFLNEYRLIPAGIEKCVAAIIIALTTVVLYLTALLACHKQGIASLTALTFAFCTSAWSTGSRALWQHGPTMLMLALALYLFVVAERIPRYAPVAIRLLSLPLAYSFVIRPTNALSIVVFSALIFVCYRAYFFSYCLWGLVVAIPFMVYNGHVYHTLLPPYYLAKGQLGGGWEVFFEALAGTLVSPSRGLFVFSPVLVFAVYGAVILFARREAQPLDYALVLIVVFHWIVSAAHPNWWAGHCYGPRYLSDMLPYLLYFLPPALVHMQRRPGFKKWLVHGLFILALGLSFFVHYRGATSEVVYAWNAGPVNVDLQPSRVWDWRDPQFLRGLL